ncbi:MAG: DUF5652 family protein [Candidatus Taylorbacteria bacterium]|nr:DUF5652 family protein [Candidatus Taylorbacteria bacterium]
MDSQTLNDTLVAYISANPWIIPVLIWSIIWKLIALWKAVKNNHLTVFIVLAFLNTLGIAEIAYLLYLYYFKTKKNRLVI